MNQNGIVPTAVSLVSAKDVLMWKTGGHTHGTGYKEEGLVVWELWGSTRTLTQKPLRTQTAKT